MSNQARQFPYQQNGLLSLNPAHWSETLPPNGPLRHWADYHAASYAVHFANTRDTNLHRESFPYLKSLAAEYADRENLPLLAPPSGSRFLVLRIRDLDLLCYLQTHKEYEFIRKTIWDKLKAVCGESKLDRGKIPPDWKISENHWNEMKAVLDESVEDDIMSIWDKNKPGWDEIVPLLDKFNTSLSGLDVLNRLVGDIDVANFTTSTDWYAGDFTESLSSLIDGEHEKPFWRRLYPNTNYSRICWEASPFYIAYQFFVKPKHERDSFLAAVLKLDHDVKWCQYLDVDRREEIFCIIARRSIKGFIHGWSARTVAKQLRDEYDDAIPKYVRDDMTFSQEIERLYYVLLQRFRFRGQASPFLLTNLLPKLCIDPLMRHGSDLANQPVELCVDGKWSYDHAVRHDGVIDLMARDAVDDVTDRKIIQGEAAGRQEKERWHQFLAPILEERCRELGISKMVRGDELFSRLYTTSMMSRNGKPGRPIYEIEKPYTCWMETLDDLKKAVSYALVRAGEKLVAITEDAFVLETPEDISPESVQAISDMVHGVCENILGLEADTWGDFVETEQLPTWPASSLPE